MTDVERKKKINKSESKLEVDKVLWKLHISWICNCLYYWQGLIMAHGVSRTSVESMKLVIHTEETDFMLFVNSLKLSCWK
jgi:hypothetical protein